MLLLRAARIRPVLPVRNALRCLSNKTNSVDEPTKFSLMEPKPGTIKELDIDKADYSEGVLNVVFEKVAALFTYPFRHHFDLPSCLSYEIIPLFILNFALRSLYTLTKYVQGESFRPIYNVSVKVKTDVLNDPRQLLVAPKRIANVLFPSLLYVIIAEIGSIFSRVFPFWILRSVANNVDADFYGKMGFFWVNSLLEQDPYYILPFIYSCLLAVLLYKQVPKKIALLFISGFIFWLLSTQNALFNLLIISHYITLLCLNFIFKRPLFIKLFKFDMHKIEDTYKTLRTDSNNNFAFVSKIKNAQLFKNNK